MDNIIKMEDAKHEYSRIIELYDKSGLGTYNPEGIEWFSETLSQLETLLRQYGSQRLYLFREDIPPNMLATQNNISKVKYDGLCEMIEKVGWEVFPVISTYVGSLGGPTKYRYVANKGHTRGLAFLRGGKKGLPAFIFDSKAAADAAELALNVNMKRMNMMRYPRISDLPMKENWDNSGLIIKADDS
jgi:hypothetical protein